MQYPIHLGSFQIVVNLMVYAYPDEVNILRTLYFWLTCNLELLGLFIRLGVGLMAGAIVSHLFVIGIESAGDGGELFILAFVVLFACIFTLFLYRSYIFHGKLVVIDTKKIG